MHNLVTIARIGRSRGTRGEVFIFPAFKLRDEPLLDAEVFLRMPGGEEQKTRIENIWWQGTKTICKLACSNDMDQAKSLVHAEIQLDRQTLAEPEDDEFFVDDLVGLKVADSSGRHLGVVEQLLDYGASMLLKLSGEPEVLIPFNSAIVDSVDLEAGVIIVDPPEGLLEINEV